MKQCFDRILSHLVQLNHQSFGLPSNIMKILGNFLEQAIYQIKTTIGIFDGSYSHNRESGFFGTGQGGVMSMYSWLMRVSQSIDSHNKNSHSAKHLDPTDSLCDIIIHILGFVDDCNLSNTGEKYETIRDILKKIHDNAQFWNNLITSSGFQLELAKYFTQTIQFKIALNVAPVISAPEEDLNFDLIDCIHDFKFYINSISAYSMNKSLGTVQGISE